MPVIGLAPDFTLPQTDGDPVALGALLADGPVVLVFAHADCPTSVLALRRLAALGPGARIACLAEETPEAAARLARRTGFRPPVLSQPAPFEISRAYAVEAVPTAVLVQPDGSVTDTVVGWDADGYERLLGVAFDAEPQRQPGCMARWTYDWQAAGLDELEDLMERGWTDGLPVVPPTPERVEAMLGGLRHSRPSGKLTCCFAEHEEASPWEPLHVERGFSPGVSTVTLIAGDAPLSISDHRSRTPEELAATLAWAAAAQWSPFWWPMDDTSLFVVCPEHAALFAAAGWSKARLREEMFDAVQRPAAELRRGETTAFVKEAPDDLHVHKWAAPEKIALVVAGGEVGRFSAVFGPCNGMQSQIVTKEVRWNT